MSEAEELRAVAAEIRRTCAAFASSVERAARIIEASHMLTSGKSKRLLIISRVVAQFFEVRLPELFGRSRCCDFVTPRHIAMAISRQLLPVSLVKVADHFNRDHGAVMHACRSVEQQRASSVAFAAKYDECLALAMSALGMSKEVAA